jgi:hypothetical protein
MLRFSIVMKRVGNIANASDHQDLINLDKAAFSMRPAFFAVADSLSCGLFDQQMPSQQIVAD